MEKRINYDKIENRKDKKHHTHHHYKKSSSQEKINLKYYKTKDTKEYKANLKNSDKNIQSINISPLESQSKNKNEQKNHHHNRHSKRNLSMISSKKEKNYLKYKLENFGKEKDKETKEEKNKRYKLFDLNNNIPKNVDKNTEKYYKTKYSNNNVYNANNSNKKHNDNYIYIDEENKYKEKSKIAYKKKEIENKELNENSEFIYSDNKLYRPNLELNNLNFINKNNEKKEKIFNSYYIENNNNIYNFKNNYARTPNNSSMNNINLKGKEGSKNKSNNYRGSVANNGFNMKIKDKFFKNNDYSNNNKNNVIEAELNLSQEKEKIKENIKNLDEKVKKRERKSSMRISSKYSEKMQSQIYEERQKIMKEQNLLEKMKNQLYHMEEIKKKESLAQDNFIKSFLETLSPSTDYNRIISQFQGGYTTLQSKLIYLDMGCTEEEFNYIYNKKNFYKSKNAKELCRRGIPLKYIKIFIKKLLNLENCNDNYQFKYSMIMKNIDPKSLGDYTPYFCGKDKKKLKEVLPIHYLNENGITQLKTTLWLLSDLVPKIEYSPIIIKICSILLIFLEKEEVYEAMRTIIDMSYNPSDIFRLKWHFRFSYMENNKLYESIRIFLENESSNMKNLFDFFRERELDPNIIIRDFCEGLFLNYFNFIGIIRFICIYLYEGAKSLYRFSYGVLNYIYEEKFEEIKNSRDDLIQQIKYIIFNVDDYKKILQDSFNLKVSRFNNCYVKNKEGEDMQEMEKPFEAPSIYNTENDNESQSMKSIKKEIKISEKNKESYLYDFYLPKFVPKSNILSDKEIIKFWTKLPKDMRHSDLVTIYSLSKKKINMKSILVLAKKYPQDYSILLIIETEQNELFGVILPKMLQETEENEYIELDNCYLVNFRPKISIYKDAYTKGINMLSCNKKGLWFCKQEIGDLFYIDGTLSEGRTCKENTYFGQVNLTRKDNFIIKDLEIIVFVKNNF